MAGTFCNGAKAHAQSSQKLYWRDIASKGGRMLTIKMLIGACVVLLISLSSKSGLYYLAGLIPLFPAFALISHVVSFSDGSEAAVREAATFGLAALVPYAVYLGIVIASLGKLPFLIALVAAVTGWIVTAGVLIFFWH